jgi:hypothetical protein
MRLHMLQIARWKSVSCNILKLVASHSRYIRLVRAAKSRGRLDQRVEYGLEVECRAADNLQNVGGGRLLLPRVC